MCYIIGRNLIFENIVIVSYNYAYCLKYAFSHSTSNKALFFSFFRFDFLVESNYDEYKRNACNLVNRIKDFSRIHFK